MGVYDALEALRERLTGLRSGYVRVVDVHYQYRTNEFDEKYLDVTLILVEPPADLAAWPIHNVNVLQCRGETEARKLGISPVFCRVRQAAATGGGRPRRTG
jgi:hypothetical protein